MPKRPAVQYAEGSEQQRCKFPLSKRADVQTCARFRVHFRSFLPRSARHVAQIVGDLSRSIRQCSSPCCCARNVPSVLAVDSHGRCDLHRQGIIATGRQLTITTHREGSSCNSVDPDLQASFREILRSKNHRRLPAAQDLAGESGSAWRPEPRTPRLLLPPLPLPLIFTERNRQSAEPILLCAAAAGDGVEVS